MLFIFLLNILISNSQYVDENLIWTKMQSSNSDVTMTIDDYIVKAS
jgi:hypothetical protein